MPHLEAVPEPRLFLRRREAVRCGLGLLLLVLWAATPARAQTTELEAAGDTYLRNGAPNRNQGDESFLRLRSLGNNRALVRFDQNEIENAVGDGSLFQARLELYVQAAKSWGPDGRTVDIHRLSQDWTESGATWNCPDDTNPRNSRADCDPTWDGGVFEEEPSDSLLQTNDLIGWVSFDVTGDVSAFLTGSPNYGWLLKNTDEARSGTLEYASREASPSFRPRLVLEVESPEFDEIPPRLRIVSPVSPVVNDPRPEIVLEYSDGGSGVDLLSLEVLLDGADITVDCSRGLESASCETISLPAGTHVVAVSLSDVAGNLATAQATFELLIGAGLHETSFLAVADTYLRRGRPNQNQGGEPILRVRALGNNRALVRFDQQELERVLAEATLISAFLELEIDRNGSNWGSGGRTVDLHRLLEDWTESGTTWNCPVDTDPSDFGPDCPQQWGGGTFESAPSDTLLHTNALAGRVVFDVTSDLAAFLAATPNFGWIVKKTEEGSSGLVEYASREALGDRAPRLRVVFELPTPLDTIPPLIRVVSPPDPVIREGPTPPIIVEYSDPGSGIDPSTVRVELDGVDVTPQCQVDSQRTQCPPPVLTGGEHTITASVEDLAGNRASTEFRFEVDRAPLEISISAPADGLITAQTQIEVSGSVAVEATSVEVNGVLAALGEGAFSATLELREGNNILIALARDASGNMGSATVQVTRDTTPPTVRIDSPLPGEILATPSVDVSGTINDIVVGTVNQAQASVTVNGIQAEVANRNFLALDVPLSPGLNTLTATGTDRVGNSSSTSIEVTFQPPAGSPHIRTVSGSPQTGVVGQTLGQALVVELLDGNGAPVAGETVVFKVVQNNGQLASSPGVFARSAAVQTDASGRASVQWRLGDRAGSGNQRVEAVAVGFTGVARFTATGLVSSAAKVNVDSGLNQSGLVGRPLALPFVVVVTDAGHNRLSGIPVTFTVREGGGSLDGAGALTITSDDLGAARAVLTLGPEEGIENNRVEADFPGNPGLPAIFSATARRAGDPAATRISGVVLDNTDQPVSGVTLTIEPTGATVQSDAQGQFLIAPAPVGLVHLRADGSTADRPGSWPTLEYELVTVAGQDNTLGRPVYLLPLDLPGGLPVDENQGGTLTLPEIPGFSLTIEPGSATFPDGSRSGLISVTVVHADKVPMVPNFGQQPRLIVTIQPAGVRFDPPAAITLPNVDGLAPGQVTELYSFDHDLGQFISIGTGTVSDDGTEVRSDPGVGILEGGWHCGGDPQATGGAENAEVEITSTNPLMMVRQDTSVVTAMGGPEPGTYEWTSSDPSVVEILPPASGEGVVQVTLQALEAGMATITVTFECRSGAQAEATLEVEVVTVDLDIEGVSDAVEESQGGLAALNDDDDNDNDQEDRNETGQVPGEDDLREITLEVEQTSDEAQITLEAVSGGSRIRVWETATKGTEVTLPVTYSSPQEVPSSLFVEGVSTTATPGEVVLRLTLETEQEQESDTVRLTVFDLEIVEPEDEDVFEIESTPEPEMPEVMARAELRGLDPARMASATFEWSAEIRSHFAENDCAFASSRNIDLILDPETTGTMYMPDFEDFIRGGDFTLIVRVTLEGRTFEDQTEDVQIHGENPARSRIQASLPHDVLRRIACQESQSTRFHRAHPENGQRQFDAAAGDATECPLFSSDGLGGVGVMQLTNPAPSDDEHWSWLANVEEGIDRFEDRAERAEEFPRRVGRSNSFRQLTMEFNAVRECNGLPPLMLSVPDFTTSGYDVDVDDLGQLELDAIRGFNGWAGSDPVLTGFELHEFKLETEEVTPPGKEETEILVVVQIDEEAGTGVARWTRVPAADRPRIGDPDYVENVLGREPECGG